MKFLKSELYDPRPPPCCSAKLLCFNYYFLIGLLLIAFLLNVISLHFMMAKPPATTPFSPIDRSFIFLLTVSSLKFSSPAPSAIQRVRPYLRCRHCPNPFSKTSSGGRPSESQTRRCSSRSFPILKTRRLCPIGYISRVSPFFRCPVFFSTHYGDPQSRAFARLSDGSTQLPVSPLFDAHVSAYVAFHERCVRQPDLVASVGVVCAQLKKKTQRNV